MENKKTELHCMVRIRSFEIKGVQNEKSLYHLNIVNTNCKRRMTFFTITREVMNERYVRFLKSIFGGLKNYVFDIILLKN